MVKGACNCGAVSFAVDAELGDVFMCHCSICRRYTGTGNIAVLIVAKTALRWLSGEDHIRRWDKPGVDWQACFCSTCGSPLPGDNDSERMFIPAGLIIEGADDLRVAHHIWTGSKAGWDVIGDDGKQHHEAFKAAP